MAEEEIRWIEDAEDNSAKAADGNDSDEEEANLGIDLFAVDLRDPSDVFMLTVGDSITLTLSGIKAKFPHLLQSTGLTLWEGSEKLCKYLCDHPQVVKDKSVVELGAGLGLCGIVAHKHGARQVILTDGDTDTLGNMRSNIASNISDAGGAASIFCKQLLWGKNVEAFREKWAQEHGFDVVMGGDIAYAQESLEILFETALELLSEKPGSVFLLSFVFRGGVTVDSVAAAAKRHELEWKRPEDSDTEGVYVFRRSK